MKCRECGIEFVANPILKGKRRKRKAYCFKCLPLHATRQDQLKIASFCGRHLNPIVRCIICNKDFLRSTKISNKMVRRIRYCLKCVPANLSNNDKYDLTIKYLPQLNNETFKCLNCGKECRVHTYINGKRYTRRKYCPECLTRNQSHYKYSSFNGKEMMCRYCGKKFIFKTNAHNTSVKCVKCFWKQRLSAIKKKAVKDRGGECQLCGYKKHNCALVLHHVDPSKKDINFHHINSWSKFKKEIKKCILLCFNCHQEFHNGRIKIPKRIIKKWIK